MPEQRLQPMPEPEPEPEPVVLSCPRTWPEGPSLVRCAPQQHAAPAPAERVGAPFEFRNRLFEGRAVVRLRGVDPAEDAAYFHGRERRMQCLVQGRFTRRVRCSDVVCGQEFSRPLELPMGFVVRPVLSVIKMMQPALQVDLFAERPHLLTPLAATAQTLSVAKPGQQSEHGFVATPRGAEAAGADGRTTAVDDPVEATALLGERHAFYPTRARRCPYRCSRDFEARFVCDQRRPNQCSSVRTSGGWFGETDRSPEERKGWYNAGAAKAAAAAAADEALTDEEQESNAEEGGEWFEPGLVYTFDFYSHVLDIQTMSAFGFDVVPILNGNPIVCMARLRDGASTGAAPATGAGTPEAADVEPEYLWKFEIWHERIVAMLAAEAEQAAAVAQKEKQAAAVKLPVDQQEQQQMVI